MWSYCWIIIHKCLMISRVNVNGRSHSYSPEWVLWLNSRSDCDQHYQDTGFLLWLTLVRISSDVDWAWGVHLENYLNSIFLCLKVICLQVFVCIDMCFLCASLCKHLSSVCLWVWLLSWTVFHPYCRTGLIPPLQFVNRLIPLRYHSILLFGLKKPV